MCSLGIFGILGSFAALNQERRLREIRKFRTLDGGRSINVGVEFPGKLVFDWAFMLISSTFYIPLITSCWGVFYLSVSQFLLIQGSVVDGVPFETWSWAEEAKTLAENPDHQRQEQVATQPDRLWQTSTRSHFPESRLSWVMYSPEFVMLLHFWWFLTFALCSLCDLCNAAGETLKRRWQR